MPLPPPPPPPPPNQPHLLPKPTILPDFLVTALSVFIFFVGPKHPHHPQSTPSSHSLSYPPTTSRRFLRHTNTNTTTTPITMSQNPNFNRAHNFPTPQSLSDWLKPRLPSDSLSTWGIKPGTKNVHNLWLELADGETSLADTTPPVRNLEVLSIRILGKNNRVLIESHQELSDGSIRKRNRPLSEKLKTGEDTEAAVKRAIREELGSILNQIQDGDLDGIVRIVHNSYERKVEERLSLSYPGLPACYVLHIVDAFVEGLPDCEFVTEESEYGDGDCGIASEAVTVRRHFWKWVSADS